MNVRGSLKLPIAYANGVIENDRMWQSAHFQRTEMEQGASGRSNNRQR